MRDDYKEFACEYTFNGSKWSFTIMARSHDEAADRVKQMAWAKVNGELHMVIPASVPGAGMFVRLLCWFKNLRR